MADLARIKGNVAKMLSMGAPETEIDAYIAQEGVTVDDVRNFQAQQPETSLMDQLRASKTYMGAGDSDAPQPQVAGNPYASPLPGPLGQLDNTIQGLVTGSQQGLTLGFSDELGAAALALPDAAIKAAQGKGFDPGQSFNEIHDANQAQVHGVEGLSPGAFHSGDVLGGLGLAGKAGQKGATLMAGAKPTIMSLATRGGVEGALYGAINGLGRGDEMGDRFAQAATGAGQGALFGAGLGAGAGWFGNMAGRAGTNKVAAALMDDQVAAADIPRLLDELGPDAKIADLGPNVQAQAAAIATTPGPGKKLIVDALMDRKKGANLRVIRDMEATIGPDPVPSHVEAEIRQNMETLRPQYTDLFRNVATRVDTQPIADNLDSLIVNLRGDQQRAVQEVRRMLDIHGAPGNLDPNPGTLFSTRNAIDGLMETETNSKVIGTLTEIRRQIDEELARAVPGIKDVDARYEQLAEQLEAVQRGQQALDSGRTAVRPVELEAEMNRVPIRGMGPSGTPFRLSQGASSEIWRLIGTNVNDVAKLRDIIKGEGSWNRERLVSLFGQDKADRLLKILERETKYAETDNLALAGSRTDVLRSAKESIEGTGPKASAIKAAANFKFGDAGAAIIEKLLGGMAKGRSQSTNAKIAEALIGRIDPNVLAQIAKAQNKKNPILQALIDAQASQATEFPLLNGGGGW